jgi:hypothetical protein
MPTRLDVIERAFRILTVKAEDESLTADQLANGGAVLDSLFAELGNEATISWTLDTTPQVSFQPLARYLAVELAPEYPPAVAPTTRGLAWRRLMATIRSDNRVDVRDLDENGIIDDAEADAGARAAYY